MSDDESSYPPELDAAKEFIEIETFEQILEMDDDDEDREFSTALVAGFFEQAEATFTSMDEALVKEDLPQLSSLGHFLKGSSATLGIIKVRDRCEKIQHWGALKDEAGNIEIKKEEALKHISTTIPKMKEEYKIAKIWLGKYLNIYDNPE
ncbi:hypothetical protein H072_951 [Dactylellina haptotyla CBS 200.50]|uniref:HPt domain-containing protein n=1 Tax=Dactylellina haptotyla (strain CBS 200.50) TaxID=1284197 RepID=S8CBE9_DACHA|nr:hypothetical protein H072_951 [Dactylellina haptotyla CBS 200.50]